VERAAVLGRLTWRLAEVAEIVPETARAATLVLDVDGWPGHRAGQHVDVRLTAEDGYQAQRSYSIASAPGESHVRLTVERLDDGEVSPYLVGELRPGDGVEIRGPVGGYFVWEPGAGEPVLLVAGGSGVVPLASMLRRRVETGDTTPMRLLYSSRAPEDVIYAAELDGLDGMDGVEVVRTYTRAQPDGWTGYARRIDEAMLAAVAWPVARRPVAYVCGPTRLVETAADGLLAAGYGPAAVRTERFGPTGGVA
jgi:ferredoxin-NADP reductase